MRWRSGNGDNAARLRSSDLGQSAAFVQNPPCNSIRTARITLSLKDPETDSLARQLASLTGESLTEGVRTSLRERLRQKQVRRGEDPELARALQQIAHRCAALPVLDDRSGDEILSYDESGLPT